MSFLSRVIPALPGSTSKTTAGDTVTASPTPSPTFEVKDLEACRTDSEITIQEPSITKRGEFGKKKLIKFIPPFMFLEPLAVLKHFWMSTSVIFLPVTNFWRKPDLDPFWKELSEKVKYEKIQDYTQGIPQLAAFINSDDSFCIWRTYGQLHSRILLQKLLELNSLETELMNLDEKDNEVPETRYRLYIGEHCDGWDTKQKNLVDKIAGKLADYDDLMLKHHALKSIPKPTKSNYESVLNYIWREQPLHEGHFDFAFRIQDFARLGLRPQNDQFHENLLLCISRWSKSPLNRLFRDPTQQHQGGIVQYYCSHRLDFVIKSFITFLIITILMVPILLLYLVPMEKALMAVVVLISLLVFAVSLAQFRDSKPQDIFFGTATYCAVLLVFLAGQSGANSMVASGT